MSARWLEGLDLKIEKSWEVVFSLNLDFSLV
jgi:hypothetical protein